MDLVKHYVYLSNQQTYNSHNFFKVFQELSKRHLQSTNYTWRTEVLNVYDTKKLNKIRIRYDFR